MRILLFLFMHIEFFAGTVIILMNARGITDMHFSHEVKFKRVRESALTAAGKILNIVNRLYQLINT